MPLKLDVERVLVGRSERVKSVDFHPTEPWVLSALYSGNVFIWNYETEVVVRTFEVSEVPVRCAKFIVRKNWIICGSDDMMIRAYNFNTCEKVKEFEAHTDYIRTIVAHPSLPFVLSGSDDMSIKLWDWDKNWENTQIFEGHTHYVMQIEINPKDTNSFASASLDRSIKVWGLNASAPHFQLEGHERGVNCVSYYPGGERPFLISGADDNIVKVWDYQTKTCVATLEGHTANISAVMFHPQLPVIITGAEDGSIKIWHSSTYRLETTLHYGMQRAWALASLPTSNRIAIGYDEGTVVIKLGQEEPVVSMDNNGNVIWARNHEIQLLHVLRVPKKSIQDGESLPLAPDDLGSVEFYPSVVTHNKNGQLVTVCGDGEYTIYTARQLRNKSFGNAMDFVWSDRNDVYATRESTSKVKIFHQFKEAHTIKTSFEAQSIFGGHLLGVRSGEFIDFYSWDDGRIVRRIEVTPNQVYWSDNGSMVALVCDENYYVLRYSEEVVKKYISQNVETDEQGIEPAFTLDQDINETVTSAFYSGEIFIYTNQNQRLNYYVGGQVITLTHLDRPCYILGYLLKEDRVYLIDRRYNIVSFELLRYVLGYQASIVRGDLETASALLKKGKIPAEHYHKLAQFLESQGHLDMALEVSTDPEHQFELALQLKKLGLAKEILLKSPSQQKWKQLGDLALSECDFATVEECAKNSNDLSLLFLLYTSTNDAKGLYAISQMAIEKSRFDIAFNSLFILGRVDDCIDLLIKNERIPEAAFMARSYAPKHIKDIHKKWRSALSKISAAAAQSLGDQTTHPDHFVTKEPESNEQALDEKEIEEMKEKLEVQKQKQIEAEKKPPKSTTPKTTTSTTMTVSSTNTTTVASPTNTTTATASTNTNVASSHGKKKSEPLKNQNLQQSINDNDFDIPSKDEKTDDQEYENDKNSFGFDGGDDDEPFESDKEKTPKKQAQTEKKNAKSKPSKEKDEDFLDFTDNNELDQDDNYDIEIADVM